MEKIRLKVKGLDSATAARFESACLGVKGVRAVDTYPGKAEISFSDASAAGRAMAALRAAGFQVTPFDCRTTEVSIEGMHCRSCELTVERKFGALPGVERVTVDAAGGCAVIESVGPAPKMADLAQAIADDGYVVKAAEEAVATPAPRPRTGHVLIAFIAAWAALSLIGRLSDSISAGSSGASGFWTAVLLGLVAGTSSCLAVSGGLMLAMLAAQRRRHPQSGFRPVAWFVAGRVAGYALLGGLIGFVGQALAPTPLATGILTVAVAVVMIGFGADMLGLTPPWLRRFMPRMPKRLSRHIASAHEKGAAPALLGAATFFIPCGFTQALQLQALAAGDFTSAAMLLGGFALGTAPALLALGWASRSFHGKRAAAFGMFAGALVVLLGLWNIQNGLTAAGYPLRLPSFGQAQGVAADLGDDGYQEVRLKLTGTDPYYSPSNRVTVKAGSPVRLTIEGVGTGCRSHFQLPRLGVVVPLTQRVNVVEFTVPAPGDYSFSCGMGMFPGTLTAI